MDAILDKLKILHYHQELCKPLYNQSPSIHFHSTLSNDVDSSLKPLTRHYFEVPNANPNEQFYYWSSLVVWLLKKVGCRMPTNQQPGQFDDPNATITNLVTNLKSMDVPCEYAPNKLRQAHGEAVLAILQHLTDRAMQNHTWRKPEFTKEDVKEDAEVNESADVNALLEAGEWAVAGEETMGLGGGGGGVEEEEHLANVQVHRGNGEAVLPRLDVNHPQKRSEPQQADLQQKYTTWELVLGETPTCGRKPWKKETEWRLEVERVAALLKVTVANDNKDWRVHLQGLTACTETIHQAWTEAKPQLAKLHHELDSAMEKIASRESYLNQHFQETLGEFKQLQEELATRKQGYNQEQVRTTDLSNELGRISEDLDRVKSEIDDLGSGMTDAKPLVQIKQAHARLKREMKEMNLKMAVLDHGLRQTRMQNKANLFTEMMRFKMVPSKSGGVGAVGAVGLQSR